MKVSQKETFDKICFFMIEFLAEFKNELSQKT